MNKCDETFEEKQNESLPPNISWPDVLEEKLTPSEDTTGKWVASTTSFERKGLRFGMESSPASAEVKGSGQAEERETEREKKKTKEWRGRGGHQSQTATKKRRACRTSQRKTKSSNTDAGWRCCRQIFTCPSCCHWKPRWAWLHGGLKGWLQVEKVTLHFHCTADEKAQQNIYLR